MRTYKLKQREKVEISGRSLQTAADGLYGQFQELDHKQMRLKRVQVAILRWQMVAKRSRGQSNKDPS